MEETDAREGFLILPRAGLLDRGIVEMIANGTADVHGLLVAMGFRVLVDPWGSADRSQLLFLLVASRHSFEEPNSNPEVACLFPATAEIATLGSQCHSRFVRIRSARVQSAVVRPDRNRQVQ